MPEARPLHPRPLDPVTLNEVALSYVARFATTEVKLRRYLDRKLRERGWVEETPAPDLAGTVARLVALGYVDDAAWGAAKAGSLARRGYGGARIAPALAAAGIARDAARLLSGAGDPREAARTYAKRRRFGPFDPAPRDPDRTRRQLAAMLRAGHAPAVARAVLAGDED